MFLASSIPFERLEQRVYLFHGQRSAWKTQYAVPHDLGDPGNLGLLTKYTNQYITFHWLDEEPWLSINAYVAHDTADWKDLAPKYLLQIYRDFMHTKNTRFLSEIWPTVKVNI